MYISDVCKEKKLAQNEVRKCVCVCVCVCVGGEWWSRYFDNMTRKSIT